MMIGTMRLTTILITMVGVGEGLGRKRKKVKDQLLTNHTTDDLAAVLPPEVLHYIADRLDTHEHLMLAQTCKMFASITRPLLAPLVSFFVCLC